MESSIFREKYFPQLVKMTYLASCSLGARSTQLVASMNDMLDCMIRPQLAWHSFEQELRLLRQRIASLIGADECQIAMMPNASIGAYQVASTLSWLKHSDIVYCDDEFPSIANVWLAEISRGASIKTIHFDKGAEEIALLYEKEISKKTKLVSVPYSCFKDGKNLPVNQIIKNAHAYGAKVFIDAYQALGVQPINVKQLDCDYLVGGTMKYLLGLPGVAFLYVKDYTSLEQEPQLTGWFGRKNPFDFNPYNLDFASEARCLETGTPAIAAAYAANAGLILISQLNLKVVRQHIVYLIKYAAESLLSQGEVLLHHPAMGDHGSHITISEMNILALIAYLEAHYITASPTINGLRIAFHYYNTKNDIDYFCRILMQYRKSIPKEVRNE